jgi:hypothetical protein
MIVVDSSALIAIFERDRAARRCYSKAMISPPRMRAR